MLLALASFQGPIHSKIALPGSKKTTRHALLLAALADGVSELSALYLDKDIKSLITALNQLGIVVQLDEKNKTCIIAGGNGNFPKKQVSLNIGPNLELVYALLAACAGTQGVYFFDAQPKLYQHDLTLLLNSLKGQGAQFIPNDKNTLPITLIGADSLAGGEINLQQNYHRFLIAALLIISPYSRTQCIFNLNDKNATRYIYNLYSLMAEFGVLVQRVHQGQFIVPVPQRYQARDYTIATDLTLAPFFCAATLLLRGNLHITCKNNTPGMQRKVKSLFIFNKLGAEITTTESSVTIIANRPLNGAVIKFKNINRYFLAIAILAPFAKGETILEYGKQLSERQQKQLQNLLTCFKQLTIKFENKERYLKIFPSIPKPTYLQIGHDVHLAIAMLILSLACRELRIDDHNKIQTHYPEFFTLWENFISVTNVFT